MFNKNYETLKLEIQDQILHLTINRPDKLNALSEQVLNELKDVQTVLSTANQDFAVRGVLLSGEGEKAFIAGADIKAMSKMTREQAYSFAQLGQAVTLGFENLNLPVIACVHGFALGGGCEIAMSADFILATRTSTFGQPEINLALIPGFGGTQRLTRFVGVARSRDLIYSGRNISAQEAHDYGLVQNLYADKEEMIAAALKMFEVYKKKSPLILAHCKQVINAGEGLPIEQGLSVEREAFGAIFETQDKVEGLNAFLEKRAAKFSGR